MPNSSRASTVVPQQALFFMNSPMTVDVVRKMLARREFAAAATDADRISALYAIVYQRAPRPEETSFGLQFIAAQTEIDPADVAKSPGKKPLVPDADKKSVARARNAKVVRAPVVNVGEIVERRPLTPWERYAQALLMTNEIVLLK
jgi:hypothetical protein